MHWHVVRETVLLYLLFFNVKLTLSGKELRILGLQPMTGDAWPGGWPCLVATEMAVEGINQHPDLLNGYTLPYDYIDHECIPGRAVYKMVRKFYEEPPFVMIVGPILSIIGTATAEVSYNWNLTQLGLGTSSPVLSDRQRFPKFCRLSAPDSKLNVARIGLLNVFGWKKIATIHHSVEYFSMVIDDFVNEAFKSNITVLSQQVLLSDPYTQIQTLKNYDARIIMTAMYEDRGKSVLCAAYKLGLYGPKIVWFFMGYYSREFWKTNLQGVDCTEAEMVAAVEGSFFIKHISVSPDEKRGIANLTYSEYVEKLKNHPKYKPEKSYFDRQAIACFDGTWASALALNCTISELKNIGHKKTLDQFTYGDSDINELIYTCLTETSFVGAGKDYSFTTDGEVENNVLIERVQEGRRISVAVYRKDLSPQRFEWIEGALQWANGKVPKDSTIVIHKEEVIPPGVYIAMSVFATLGIVLALSLFVFNVVSRDNRHVKMSSPNINNVLLFGCVICYVSVYLKPIEVTTALVCKLRTIFFCMGFTITFGALFSKTWRVYRLFTNKKPTRMSIKDSQLFVITGVLVGVVLLVLVVWEFVSPHKVIVHVLENQVYTNDKEDEIHPYVRVCYSRSTSYFSWLIYVMEGALMAFGAFLAWETRHVHITALNDSHQIGLCVYNVVILSAVGLTLSLLLDGQDVLLYGVTSACLIIGTTLTQLIVFIPKELSVKDKTKAVSVLDISNVDGILRLRLIVLAVYNKVEVCDLSTSTATMSLSRPPMGNRRSTVGEQFSFSKQKEWSSAT